VRDGIKVGPNQVVKRSNPFSTRLLLSPAHYHLIGSGIVQLGNQKINPCLCVDVVFVQNIVTAKLWIAKAGVGTPTR
jgi:hypothetical protein